MLLNKITIHPIMDARDDGELKKNHKHIVRVAIRKKKSVKEFKSH